MKLLLILPISLVLFSGCLRPPSPAASTPQAPSAGAAPSAPGAAWPFSGGKPVTIEVNADKVLGPVTPLQFGNNTSWWAGKAWTLDPDRVQKAREANIRFWRFPGGSSSDEYLWDGDATKWGNGPPGKNSIHMNESWAANTDDFLSFLKQVDGQGIITLNYGIARYGSLDKAIDLAKGWVKSLNIDKHAKIEYFEVGNESHGPWETGHNVPDKPELTGALYGADARAICTAIKTVDASVKCGAVAVVYDNGEEWTGYKWWMRDLLPQIESSADFLIVHEYFHWPFQNDQFVSPSNQALFGNVRKVKEGAQSVAAMTRKYTKRTTDFPLALTEFNILNGNVPQTLQLINGLFTAEVLGEAITAGYFATNFWDWKNGYDGKYGGGDHALLATKDPQVPENTPRPAYYAYAVFGRAFGDRLVESKSSDPSVKVYASRFGDRPDLGLVVVNEGSEPVTLRLSIGPAKRSLKAWVLTGASLNGTEVTFNGKAGPKGGGGPFPIDPIEPYTLTLDGKDPSNVSIPAASVVGLRLAD